MDQFSARNKGLKAGGRQDAERNMCASVFLGICMPYLETEGGNIQSYDFGQHGQACKEEGIKHGLAVGKATIFCCQQERLETTRKGAPWRKGHAKGIQNK